LADQKKALVDPATFAQILRPVIPDPEEFPIVAEQIDYGYARVRLEFRPSQLRMGNTISGPTLFALSDTTLFAAVLSVFGTEREAVTSDMTIRFLARPQPVDTIAEAKILRAGKRSATGEITLFSDGSPDPVAKCLGGFTVVDAKSTEEG